MISVTISLMCLGGMVEGAFGQRDVWATQGADRCVMMALDAATDVRVVEK